MSIPDLAEISRGSIDGLNRLDWDNLGTFVDDDVQYNGEHVGLSGYRAMLERDFRDIPDLWFNIKFLVSDEKRVGSRLDFHCSPQGKFLGVNVNGKRISFSENVFYEFRDGKIFEVWSVIDKTAVEAQT